MKIGGTMKIGIIGSGNMGGSLGKIWARKGHEVIFSFSQDPTKLDALAQSGGSGARAGTPRQAAEESEVVLISVWPPALPQALEAAGPLTGKIVITCMSGLKPDFTGQTVGLPTSRTFSMAEELAQLVPGAKVVEAFNITFAETLASDSRSFGGEHPSIFYCGEDTEAKAVVSRLIADADYEPVDAGGIRTARSLETLASAWVQFAAVSGLFPELALKALRR